MKKRRDLKRKGTAFVAVALATGMLVPTMAFAAGPTVKVGTDSDVQMSSDPEAVYVNNYTGTTRSENFNENWKFYMGDATGAENPGFNDSSWKQVNLPHDYSIEQEYTKTGEAESGYLLGGTGWYRKNFTLDSSAAGKRIRIDFGGVYMNSTVWVNGTQVGTHPYGYTPFSFDITDYVKVGGDNVITVKVDHQTPSSRWYSGSGIYRSVDLTVTDPVHVDLYGTKIETPNLESEAGSTVNTEVSTTVVNDSAEPKSVTLTHTVFLKDGEPADSIGTMTTDAVEVAAGSSTEIDAAVPVNNPTLWDTSDDPALYTVRTEVKVNDQVVDTYDTEYGYRYFKFDSNTGFYLNGEMMKLKGVCMHHDQGALGAEAWESAIDRQVRILKEMGCNSIRVTHNPAADELIEACNEQGILVIDEAFDGWAWAKNGNSYDYSRFFNETIGAENQILGGAENMTWAQFDLSAMIKRGQNAPSVIMWSLGNEVQEGTSVYLNQQYAAIQANLIEWTKEVDDTRPVTRGCNAIKGNTSGIIAEMMDSLSKAGGIAGCNYSSGSQYDTQHNAHSDWFIYGAETASSVNSRGVYDRLGAGEADKTSDKKLSSYDNSHVGWGATASSAWYDIITRDFMAGEYVWTGFDYIGEPTPWNGTTSGAVGTWPSPKNSYFGIIDTAGFPKDSYYFYQSQWNDEVGTLHILPAWNEDVVYKDGSNNVQVVVYTDAKKVELFFTPEGSDEAKSLGEKEFTQKTTTAGYTYQIYEESDKNSTENKNLYLTWNVPYEDGTITAKAWDASGKEIDLNTVEGRTSVTTTGKEAKLSASADRTTIAADGADLTYITVDITDEDGNIVPDAANNVKFTVEGEGTLVGVDNGKQDDHQSYQDDNRDAFSGKVLAIVQSTRTAGEITVTANAEGLEPSTVTVSTTPVESESGEKTLNYYRMSRNYYVKTGNMPQIPATVTAVYSDGTTEDMSVEWETVTEDQIAKTGTFSVSGTTAAGDTLSVTVNMIDEVAALLNYSTTVPVGQEPTLPESRPAVLQTGEVISASFPVTWKIPEGRYYDNVGSVTIEGTANVLGKELTVTATVRVQEQQIAIGDNVAGAAHLSQDVPEGQQSDTLTAIQDGDMAISDNTSGGPNPTVWSNWETRQTDTDSEITFRYDTQQRVGQMTVYFARDNNSMTFPDKGTTKIYISETGVEGSWSEIPATEEIADAENPNRVKAYTYTFDPVTATYVKLYIKNAATREDGKTPCTGITEVVINEWEGSYTTNSTATLQSLSVNGLDVSAADLAAGSYNTEAILIDDIQYPGADNAAVTYIPPYENEAKLIIESEDHSKRTTFTINLGVEASSGDPEDDSRDYPVDKMTATAGSEYTGGDSDTDGPAGWAIDGNLNTWWHTNYPGTVAAEERYITLDLGSEQAIDGYRYYSRSGQSNGRVGDYKIEVSTDGQSWTEVAVGTWENTVGWKLAEFDAVDARYVRLTGVTTYGEGAQQNQFMTAAEVRVRLAADNLVNISDATVEPITKKVSIVDPDHPVTLTGDDIKASLADGTKLRYGIDYIIASYENNTAEGTAKAVLQGLGQYGYTGTQEIEFRIELRDPVMTGIEITAPCKLDYTEGDLFDPSALVLTASYDNGMTQTISYADNAADITFTLADGTPLTPETALTLDQDGAVVTVTYGGMTTAFNINVSKATDPDPGEATKDDLKAAIDKAEGILGQTDKYTADSLAEYQKYVDAAYAVYNNPDATAADYAKAISDLANAEKYLVLIDGNKPENPDKPNGGTGNGGSGHGSGSGDKAVQTGDTANFAMWGAAVLLAVAGAAGALARFRMKKQK